MQLTRLIILKSIVALLLIGSISWYVFQSDWTSIYNCLNAVGFQFLWLIGITFMSYAMGAIAWKYCFSEHYDNLSIKNLFIIRLIGDNITVVNPTNVIGGETSKVYLLNKIGIPIHKGISSVVLSKLLMVVTHVILFLVAALSYIISKGQSDSFLAILIIVILLKSLLIWIFFRYRKNLKIFNKLIAKFGLRLYKFKRKFLETLAVLRSYFRMRKKSLFLATIFSFSHWIIASIEIYLILNFLGLDINLLEVILIDSGIIFLKSFGAFVPGQIGIEEYSNKLMLAIIGITSIPIWLSVSILRRARQLVWILISLIAYLYYFKSNNKYQLLNAYGNSVHHA